MIIFIINLFLTIYTILIWIFLSFFIFLIINDETAIKEMFAKFIIRICKIWEIDKDDLFYTINKLRQKG